jgi:hypothetical protein
MGLAEDIANCFLNFFLHSLRLTHPSHSESFTTLLILLLLDLRQEPRLDIKIVPQHFSVLAQKRPCLEQSHVLSDTFIHTIDIPLAKTHTHLLSRGLGLTP